MLKSSKQRKTTSMGTPNLLVAVVLLAMASSALSYDPNPLQDFCVATPFPKPNAVFVNGNFCKDPIDVVSEDFVFRPGFNVPGNTSNQLGSSIRPANVLAFPGLNTLGITVVRLDYEPGGINAPHFHPRASEMLTCLEGTLYAGFVTSNPENRLLAKIMRPGDIMTFPRGLIHFQLNIGETPALGFVSQNSQNPGVVIIADAVFGSNPPIREDILAQAFQIDERLALYIQAQFFGPDS